MTRSSRSVEILLISSLLISCVSFGHASVSVNKNGDLLLNSLLNGNIILSSPQDILFEHKTDSVSLVRLLDVMEGVAGQICYLSPKHPLSTWQPLSDMPVALQGFATVVVSQNVLLIGGLDVNNISQSSVYIYNTLTNSWSTGASMTNARAFPFAAANSDGSKLFVFGGFQVNLGGILDVTAIEVYDLVMNQWTNFPTPMTTLHRRGASGIVGNTICLFGGELPNGVIYGNVSCFDLDSETWNHTKTAMPTPRTMTGTFSLDSTVYVSGGYDGSFESEMFEQYNVDTDTWISSTNPAPGVRRSQMAATVLDKLGFVTGGYSPIISQGVGTGLMNSGFVFNPRVAGWESSIIPLLTKERKNFGMVTVSGYIYLFGGFDGSSAMSLVERTNPCF